jgi:NitT/TauT family transport system substrate-binding protein
MRNLTARNLTARNLTARKLAARKLTVRKLAAVITVTLAAAQLAGCGALAGPQTPEVADTGSYVVGMSYIPNIQFAPFYLADHEGWLTGVPGYSSGLDGDHATEKDATWKVSLRHHGADEGLFTAIASGQEQFTVAGADEALQAAEQGVELVALAPYYRDYPVRVIVPEDSAITQLADLKGKRIGVPGRYGESWFGLLVALKSAGLAEDEVEITEIGYTAQAALPTGKVDAVIGFVNNDFVQFQTAGFPVRALQLTDSGQPPLVGATVFTTREFKEQHPLVVERLAEGIVEASLNLAYPPNDNLDVCLSYLPDLTAEGKAAAEATFAATAPLWRVPEGEPALEFDRAQWQAMADFMLQVGILSAPADVEALLP